jgi:hypothetical protein
MILKLEKNFQARAQGRFGKYEFEVGVLQDGPHRQARQGKRGLGGKDVISSYAGGPVRKASRKPGPLTIAEVSKANRERLGFNYLTKPFENTGTDIRRFVDEFFKIVFGKSEKRRAENLLQAVVRNPILRGDYGANSALTRRIKGFDRKMIDTAQLFKSIRAVCRVKAGKRV